MRSFKAWIDPLSNDERKSLALFCECVAELEESALFKNLLHRNEIRWNHRWTDDVLVQTEILDLDEEHLKAFVLTARLFAQNNERGSIGNVSKIISQHVGDRHPFSWNFHGWRAGLNNFLDRSRDVRVVAGSDESLTNRDVLDVFLYGHYAHRNKNHEASYQKWKEQPLVFTELKANFLLSLSNLFATAREMRTLILPVLGKAR